jgi:two-component sensor histidine kinase
MVEVPTRRGFGSRLIRGGLVGNGGVDLRYEATGFEADFEASVSRLAQA